MQYFIVLRGVCFFFLTLGFHQGLPLLCVAGCWGWEVGFGELTLLSRKAAAAWSGTGKTESLFGLKSKTSHELVSSWHRTELDIVRKIPKRELKWVYCSFFLLQIPG